MNTKKHSIARRITNQVNHRSFESCEDNDQKDSWYAEFGRVATVLGELEKMSGKGEIQFSYKRLEENE